MAGCLQCAPGMQVLPQRACPLQHASASPHMRRVSPHFLRSPLVASRAGGHSGRCRLRGDQGGGGGSGRVQRKEGQEGTGRILGTGPATFGKAADHAIQTHRLSP